MQYASIIWISAYLLELLFLSLTHSLLSEVHLASTVQTILTIHMKYTITFQIPKDKLKANYEFSYLSS